MSDARSGDRSTEVIEAGAIFDRGQVAEADLTPYTTGRTAGVNSTARDGRSRATADDEVDRVEPRARVPRRIRGSNAWTLVSVAFGVIMVGIDGTVVAIANPYIGRSLHGSLSDLQWVTNAYLLALAVLLIPMGKLGDRYGRRLLFLIGVTGFALSSLAVGLVGSIGGVIIFRAIEGGFGAMLLPNTLAIIRATFPPERLNRAVGIWGGASGISVAAGPIVGGLLVEHISWQSVFFINVPVGALALVIGLLVLRESRASGPLGRPDLAGVAFLGTGLFGIVFGLIKAETWGWGSGYTLGFLLGGLVLLGGFALAERGKATALVPLRLFRNRSISFAAISVAMTFFAMYGVLFFVTLYLENIRGLDPVTAGVYLLPLTAMFVIASPAGALLNEKLGPRAAIPFGMVCVGVAMLLLLSLQPHSGYIHLWPAFLLVGVGVGVVVVAASDAIVANAPVADAGVAGGLQSTAFQLGGVIGTSVLGSILATRIAARFIPTFVAHGVPLKLATALKRAAPLVTEGVAPSGHGIPRGLHTAVVASTNAAFLGGLKEALAIAAIVSFVAAGIGLFVRRPPLDDEHASMPVL
jgi:EmrB/QacA subfamily drug resistance transporter